MMTNTMQAGKAYKNVLFWTDLQQAYTHLANYIGLEMSISDTSPELTFYYLGACLLLGTLSLGEVNSALSLPFSPSVSEYGGYIFL